MGYTTKFEGAFKFDKPLKPEHNAYLSTFSASRRMFWNVGMLENAADPLRIAVGLPLGPGGAFYVAGGATISGRLNDELIRDYNKPPPGQPGLWCQWVPNEAGDKLEWDQVEKFYNYTEWLKFLIITFLIPWGYTLNGEVTWQGEDAKDIGKLVVKDNVVAVKKGWIQYEE